MRMSLLIFILTIATCSAQIGKLIDPPHRGSMWRFVHEAEVNKFDDKLNCGGPKSLVRNKNKCGLCGDPFSNIRHHEYGGKYAAGILSKQYLNGEHLIHTVVQMGSKHNGYFEFRLCVQNEYKKLTAECLMRNQLKIVGGSLQSEQRRYYTRKQGPREYQLKVELPQNISCLHCVLQWSFTSEKDLESKTCQDCGYTGQIRNCADISIGNKQSRTSQENTNRMSSSKYSPIKSESFRFGQSNVAMLTNVLKDRHYDSGINLKNDELTNLTSSFEKHKGLHMQQESKYFLSNLTSKFKSQNERSDIFYRKRTKNDNGYKKNINGYTKHSLIGYLRKTKNKRIKRQTPPNTESNRFKRINQNISKLSEAIKKIEKDSGKGKKNKINNSKGSNDSKKSQRIDFNEATKEKKKGENAESKMKKLKDEKMYKTPLKKTIKHKSVTSDKNQQDNGIMVKESSHQDKSTKPNDKKKKSKKSKKKKKKSKSKKRRKQKNKSDISNVDKVNSTMKETNEKSKLKLENIKIVNSTKKHKNSTIAEINKKKITDSKGPLDKLKSDSSVKLDSKQDKNMPDLYRMAFTLSVAENPKEKRVNELLKTSNITDQTNHKNTSGNSKEKTNNTRRFNMDAKTTEDPNSHIQNKKVNSGHPRKDSNVDLEAIKQIRNPEYEIVLSVTTPSSVNHKSEPNPTDIMPQPTPLPKIIKENSYIPDTNIDYKQDKAGKVKHDNKVDSAVHSQNKSNVIYKTPETSSSKNRIATTKDVSLASGQNKAAQNTTTNVLNKSDIKLTKSANNSTTGDSRFVTYSIDLGPHTIQFITKEDPLSNYLDLNDNNLIRTADINSKHNSKVNSWEDKHHTSADLYGPDANKLVKTGNDPTSNLLEINDITFLKPDNKFAKSGVNTTNSTNLDNGNTNSKTGNDLPLNTINNYINLLKLAKATVKNEAQNTIYPKVLVQRKNSVKNITANTQNVPINNSRYNQFLSTSKHPNSVSFNDLTAKQPENSNFMKFKNSKRTLNSVRHGASAGIPPGVPILPLIKQEPFKWLMSYLADNLPTLESNPTQTMFLTNGPGSNSNSNRVIENHIKNTNVHRSFFEVSDYNEENNKLENGERELAKSDGKGAVTGSDKNVDYNSVDEDAYFYDMGSSIPKKIFMPTRRHDPKKKFDSEKRETESEQKGLVSFLSDVSPAMLPTSVENRGKHISPAMLRTSVENRDKHISPAMLPTSVEHKEKKDLNKNKPIITNKNLFAPSHTNSVISKVISDLQRVDKSNIDAESKEYIASEISKSLNNKIESLKDKTREQKENNKKTGKQRKTLSKSKTLQRSFSQNRRTGTTKTKTGKSQTINKNQKVVKFTRRFPGYSVTRIQSNGLPPIFVRRRIVRLPRRFMRRRPLFRRRQIRKQKFRQPRIRRLIFFGKDGKPKLYMYKQKVPRGK